MGRITPYIMMENKTCSKPPARDIHLTHLLFAIKKTSLFIGSTCFLHRILARCGIQQTQAIPVELLAATESYQKTTICFPWTSPFLLGESPFSYVFCETTNGFPIYFATNMLFLWVFPMVFFHPKKKGNHPKPSKTIQKCCSYGFFLWFSSIQKIGNHP